MAQTLAELSTQVTRLEREVFHLRLRDEQRERELSEARTRLESLGGQVQDCRAKVISSTRMLAFLMVTSGTASTTVPLMIR